MIMDDIIRKLFVEGGPVQKRASRALDPIAAVNEKLLIRTLSYSYSSSGVSTTTSKYPL